MTYVSSSARAAAALRATHASEVHAAVPPAEHHELRRILLAVDVTMLAAAWSTSLLAGTNRLTEGLAAVVALVGVGLVLARWQCLYQARTCVVRTVEISRILRVAALSGVAAWWLGSAYTDHSTARTLAGAALCAGALVAGRGGFRTWVRGARKEGRYVRRLIVVGTNSEAHHLVNVLTTHPEAGYEVQGVVGDIDSFQQHRFRVPRLGDVGDALDVIERTGAGGVLVAATSVTPSQLNTLIRMLLDIGVHVQLSSGVQGVSHTRLRPSPLAHEPVFYLEPLRLSRVQEATKRAIDVALSGLLLLLALPVLVVAAVVIKLDDPGPVLYRQRRPGRNGVPFEILKLRTMSVGSDRLEPLVADEVRGPRAKVEVDPRRTRVGRVLERTSIDELPQLLNVLKGEMSMVGPRPALLHEAARFDAQLQRRHTVRPGITGLWQVEARDNPAFEAYRRYDLFYIENWSLVLDLAILLATAQTVAQRGLVCPWRRALRRPPEIVLN